MRQINIAEIDFPLLCSQQDWEKGVVPASLKSAQDDIAWAKHIVLFFPLWLGDMPAKLKGFLEQVARPGFAFTREEGGNPWGKKALTGRTARPTASNHLSEILGYVGIAPLLGSA